MFVDWHPGHRDATREFDDQKNLYLDIFLAISAGLDPM